MSNNTQRINVTDDDGNLVGWFDRFAAEEFPEDSFHDGSNLVSVPTGSQWDHEVLLRTAGGRWVLAEWSQWQGSGPARYRFLSEDSAGRWLLAQRCDEDYERFFGPVPAEHMLVAS